MVIKKFSKLPPFNNRRVPEPQTGTRVAAEHIWTKDETAAKEHFVVTFNEYLLISDQTCYVFGRGSEFTHLYASIVAVHQVAHFSFMYYVKTFDLFGFGITDKRFSGSGTQTGCYFIDHKGYIRQRSNVLNFERKIN